MSLFQLNPFTSHSGLTLPFKIECDALTEDDWEALAAVAVPMLPPFTHVFGVPLGGMKFESALAKHVAQEPQPHRVLVCDDVLTTGASMEKARAQYPAAHVIGLVAFARGDWPSWVTPIFALRGCKQKEPVT